MTFNTMNNCIHIFINGQLYLISKKIELNSLMEYFNYKATLFILEYNNLIYDQIKWNKIILQNNDKIELITIVGGG